jgi:hypothetical protein
MMRKYLAILLIVCLTREKAYLLYVWLLLVTDWLIE